MCREQAFTETRGQLETVYCYRAPHETRRECRRRDCSAPREAN